ncbi:hypothetical protein [Deinococcus wulumuqiensis]|uniref:hypothetical protein n=1 Tax=Deinococcus wulumuqiensis TaxID=980427 RepID=UPI00242B6CEA|nr:hypothetical protein [Deinococcus wulumuqiensis]
MNDSRKQALAVVANLRPRREGERRCRKCRKNEQGQPQTGRIRCGVCKGEGWSK